MIKHIHLAQSTELEAAHASRASDTIGRDSSRSWWCVHASVPVCRRVRRTPSVTTLVHIRVFTQGDRSTSLQTQQVKAQRTHHSWQLRDRRRSCTCASERHRQVHSRKPSLSSSCSSRSRLTRASALQSRSAVDSSASQWLHAHRRHDNKILTRSETTSALEQGNQRHARSAQTGPGRPVLLKPRLDGTDPFALIFKGVCLVLAQPPSRPVSNLQSSPRDVLFSTHILSHIDRCKRRTCSPPRRHKTLVCASLSIAHDDSNISRQDSRTDRYERVARGYVEPLCGSPSSCS